MAEIRNVILDWSGTLVDDFGPVLEASNEIFKQYGKPVWSADEFREKFANPFVAAGRGFVDEVIPPRQTRRKLITALKNLENKRDRNPPKKHGNIPL